MDAGPIEIKTPIAKAWFQKFTLTSTIWLSSRWILSAVGIIVLLGRVAGLLHNFSGHWQLIINTGSTLLLFLMMFLILNAQNRDARAVNLKLNQLYLAIHERNGQMTGTQALSNLELNELKRQYEKSMRHVRNAKNRSVPSNE